MEMISPSLKKDITDLSQKQNGNDFSKFEEGYNWSHLAFIGTMTVEVLCVITIHHKDQI